MEDFTTPQIILAGFVSLGGISGFVAFASLVAARLDKRRERLKEGRKEQLDARKLELESEEKKDAREREDCWKIVDAKNQQIADLKGEIKGLEDELAETVKGSKLSRKMINQIYENLASMKNELKHLNMMIWDDEKTNVFMTRFAAVQAKIDETEALLP